MAVLKGNVLGIISGRIGDNCYRDFNDKTIVASRPKRDKNDHPNCLAPKKKFGHTSPLASYVNKIPSLQKIWRIADTRSFSAFHSMMSWNTNSASLAHLTTKNVISPPGEKLNVSNVIITPELIRANLEIHGGTFPSPFDAVVLIYAYNKTGDEKNIRFYDITAGFSAAGETKEFELTFNPYPFTLNWMSNFQNWIMYFTLIKDDGITPVIWTSTAAYHSTP